MEYEDTVVITHISCCANGCKIAIPKPLQIAHHLLLPYCHHVPPSSRKTQCAKYNSNSMLIWTTYNSIC